MAEGARPQPAAGEVLALFAPSSLLLRLWLCAAEVLLLPSASKPRREAPISELAESAVPFLAGRSGRRALWLPDDLELASEAVDRTRAVAFPCEELL